QELDCRLEDIAGDRGEVFANFRGLVMAGDPPGPGGPDAPQASETADAGIDRQFSTGGAAADAVVKAYWPLLSRITPRTGVHELVACGVLDWRALYISALGAPPRSALHQEG